MKTQVAAERQEQTDVAAIIGRWQVDDLTKGHRVLIDEVMRIHGKVIIFIGVAPVIGSRRDPLDYPTRAAMVLQHYPSAITLPIADQPSDEVWSRNLDHLIRSIVPVGKITLYGGRDSFIPHYKGGFPCVMLADMNYSSGTEVRKEVGRRVRSSSDFRAGAIYSCFQQRKRNNLVIDVAVVRDNQQDGDPSILLGKKENEKTFRFPGGFVDPSDPTAEAAVRREVEEETGVTVDGIKYIGSFQQDDWRMGESDRMLTFFFEASYIHGPTKAGDDLAEVSWVPFSQLRQVKMHPDHEKLRDAFLSRIEAPIANGRLKVKKG